MEKALEENDTGDGKDRSKFQKDKMDQYVAAEGEAILTKGDADSKNEHGDSQQIDEPNAHKGNVHEDMMDDSVDLECAPGSSSDILIATPAKPSRPDNLVDAPDRRVETRVHTPVQKKPTKRRNTGVHLGARSQGQDRGRRRGRPHGGGV